MIIFANDYGVDFWLGLAQDNNDEPAAQQPKLHQDDDDWIEFATRQAGEMMPINIADDIVDKWKLSHGDRVTTPKVYLPLIFHDSSPSFLL